MRLLGALLVLAVHASTANAAHFLPHKQHLTLPEKVAFFHRSIRHERQAIAWLGSRQAPRTLQRVSELAWFRAALRWHTRLLASYQARLPASSPRAYARQLALAQGWGGFEWQALDTIVGRESSWNPCRHYPSTTDCSYAGQNACGIPQRNPCPASWRGRLAQSWREQVVELIHYVRGRYGTPSHALAVWNVQGSY